MGRSFNSRTLLIICCALAGLLALLAVVQYRWSTRVAAADLQREKEHLDSAAALFASEFNKTAGQALLFLQNDAWAAVKSGEALAGVPKIIGELYYLNIPESGQQETQRLTAEGHFEPTVLPEWIVLPHCAAAAIVQPAALITPIYDMTSTASLGEDGEQTLKTFRWRSDRCFVAKIDQKYLSDTFFPQLIRGSFGATSASEYNFAVVARNPPFEAVYGKASAERADVRKPFFSVVPINLGFARVPPGESPPPGHRAIIVQHVESTIVTRGTTRLVDLFGEGLWELDVAHKGLPLIAAFERTRQRDLLLSIGVETLLLATIVFLVIAARRMQQLADQKMQFVAGVSHELRTPVSAIAMLARNQADGLVAGTEKVKQYGELIHQQSRRLNEMVEQTLQYAGIHSGLRRIAKDDVDLSSLIQEAVDARREELARGGFEVEMALDPDLPRVPGDASLLRTAFDNLLSNARNHAEGGHWIRVSAAYIAAEKEVRISVEDRGAGVDPADQVEIFEPFCRGRAAIEAQIPGSGLGLSLVRSAAEAHRGSVTLESEPGRGSTFTMHLPV